jgi:Rps23 Pro-64 3,4-dihydroxylase Tpa1-like proline 4-hydroxylase
MATITPSLTMALLQKNNDLYHFGQSKDLKGLKEPIICKFREVIYSTKFRELLKSISGIDTSELEATVDISAAVYSQTQYLLPHDDRLSGRRIAFI